MSDLKTSATPTAPSSPALHPAEADMSDDRNRFSLVGTEVREGD